MEYTYGKFIIEDKPSNKPLHLAYGINFEGFKEEWSNDLCDMVIVPRFSVTRNEDHFCPQLTVIRWVRHALMHYSWVYDLMTTCTPSHVQNGFSLLFTKFKLQDELEFVMSVDDDDQPAIETVVSLINKNNAEIDLFVQEVSA